MFRIFMFAMASTLAVALAGGVPRTAAEEPSSSTPGVVGRDSETLADQFFHVQWTSAGGRVGESRITGYVYNEYGQPAMHVQIRIIGLDASGRPVESTIRPIGNVVPGNGRAYFDVRAPQTPAFKVRVTSFDFLEFPNI